MAEDNSSDATKNTEPSASDDPKATPPSQGGTADDKPKTFSQDDLDRLLAKIRREEKAKYEKELENANKSEVERLKADLADRDAKLAERETKDEVTGFLQKNGCKRPEATFLLVKSSISRGKDGKIEDLKGLLAEAKTLAPEFFDDVKRAGSADAGAKAAGKTATDMNAWLRGDSSLS
jgi:hypothetical protein